MSVGLTTSLFYDRAAASMSALTAQSDKLNTQISTQQKVSVASDDPVAYQRLRTIARDTSDATADQANVTVAQGVLSVADSTLSSVTSQLQRASELTESAQNQTLSDTDRAAIAQELASIADTLTGLANTKDTRGLPVFGGSGTGDAVTTNADGTHTLAAGTTPSIPIGNGQTVQPGENATQVFGLKDGRNVIDVIAQLATALQAGGDTTAALSDASGALGDASTQVTDVQASLGARAARLDIVGTQITTDNASRETARSGLQDVDVTQAITQLQKTMTVLQATQASFTKLSSLSLFDYLKT